MRALIGWLFHKVTYACTHCGARQRIPLRRVHFDPENPSKHVLHAS